MNQPTSICPKQDLSKRQTTLLKVLEILKGVVIVRHGVIVAERYTNGASENSLATSWSTGKSFASALIGIAIDQGYIDSIDVPC